MPRSTAPGLYRQLADKLLAQIEAGVWLPGQRLPSVRQLMAQEGRSLATVTAALQLLEQQGGVQAQPRSGFYVHPQWRARPPEPSRTRTGLTRQSPQLSRLAAEVNLAAQWPDLVPLGAAVVHDDLLPGQALQQALAEVARWKRQDCLRYALPPGRPELRRQIVRLMRDWACELTPEQVLITAGETDALDLALRTVTRPGDCVAVESPTYFGILQALEHLGLQALEIATDPRHGLDVDELMRVAQKRRLAAVVLTPNFHNPFGCCMPEAEKARLVAWAAQQQVPLIEDDVFGDLHFGPQRPPPCKAFDAEGWVLTCSSFSKTLAPGYRVGWCVPGRFLEPMLRLQMARNLAAPAPTQLAVAEYLQGRAYGRHLAALRQRFAEQKPRLLAQIARCFPAGTRASDPQGGYLYWLELPQGDSLALYRQALDTGISLAPGAMFSASGRFDHCLRLSLGLTWSPRVASAIERLGQLASG